MLSYISVVSPDRYSSLPSEQRLKTLAQLQQKSVENDKNTPVYLQIELSKGQPNRLPFSITA